MTVEVFVGVVLVGRVGMTVNGRVVNVWLVRTVVLVGVTVTAGAGAGRLGSADADLRFAPADSRPGAVTAPNVTCEGPGGASSPAKLLARYAVPKPRTAAAAMAAQNGTRGVTECSRK